MAKGKPLKFKNKDELEKAIQEYKDYLESNEKPPTIAGLAYYTGIDRQTLYNYQKRDEYFDTIKNFKDWVVMNYEEEAAIKGHSGVIFLLKNLGYTDKTKEELNKTKADTDFVKTRTKALKGIDKDTSMMNELIKTINNDD